MKLDCIPVTLSLLYKKLGIFVSRYPLPFLIAPLILTGLCLLGMMNAEFTSEPEYLYTPVNGPAKDERDYFDDDFPTNDRSDFSSIRNTKLEGYLRVHIEDKNDGNVLNNNAIAAAFEVQDTILNVKAKYKGHNYKYEDVCAIWNGNCTYPGILKILAESDPENIQIRYPFHPIPNDETVNLIQQLGDVKTDENGYVTKARSILLAYYALYDKSSDQDRTAAWIDEVRDKMLDYADDNPNSKINIEFESAFSIEQELERSVQEVYPLFAIAFLVLASFAVFATLMSDQVRSKPIVALSGMLVAIMGIISSIGFMSGCGLKLASVVGTMPFLIIGIGLDNMFIMVSAWRYTSFKKSVSERMGETMSEAAVSITITTVTDILAFGIGTLTPFRSITIFCAYAGAAVFFVYLYMLSFLAAVLTYSGRREEANRHPFSCRKLPTKDEAAGRSKAYLLCCAGGSVENGIEATIAKDSQEMTSQNNTSGHHDDPSHSNEKQGIQLPFMNEFLGNQYATFLMRTPVKVAVIVVYLVLLGVGIYGVTELQEGLDRSNLVPDGSYFSDFNEKYTRDFADFYGPMIMVAIDEPLDYSNPGVRDDITDILRGFQNNKYFVSNPLFVISWVDRFEAFLNADNRTMTDMSMPEIIQVLNDEFFIRDDYRIFQLDIKIDAANERILASRFFVQSQQLSDTKEEVAMKEDARDLADSAKYKVKVDASNERILASRFFVQSQQLSDTNEEVAMMDDARDLADSAKYKVKVFSPVFIFFDSYGIILINTVQNLGIAVASMMVVAFLLIPSFTTVLWVTFAVMSICLCIIGYMAHWGVSLDSVSMINLVMCIGFSVDFSAHISYHFVISKSSSPTESARDALGYLGTPVAQGAASTILGVLALAASTSYIFRAFFKVIFLVMTFGFFHAMFLLPILLTTLQCRRCCKKDKGSSHKVSSRENSVVPASEKVANGSKPITNDNSNGVVKGGDVIGHDNVAYKSDYI